ncbi:adiponectin receptor protein 2 [Lingula anatina]|uniref:Adiponectin receptor protein 2 n=1 Tax=Lingula anatina TaxID=7574 RepID=A0A1S3JUM8_LINAN|nr:adiponectin receptor protein 2 [Lingula anatina]|eukprot:XP_013397290.1 adiponectin receptor protein 2 [Lingula anatina]
MSVSPTTEVGFPRPTQQERTTVTKRNNTQTASIPSTDSNTSHTQSMSKPSTSNSRSSTNTALVEDSPQLISLADTEDLDDPDNGLSGDEVRKKTEEGKLLQDANYEHNSENDDEEEAGEEDALNPAVDIIHAIGRRMEQAEEFVKKGWWEIVHHNHLPNWLKDNEFLLHGHRPQLNSFSDCFKSVFRIHTETGNIWTHLLGFIAFIGIAGYFLSRPTIEVQWQEKAVFSAFFLGAILCLGFSWVFHTVYCHSERVGRLFNKLDYCGIALLTMGSFVPWLYYSFYCELGPKIAYLVLIFTLGGFCILVSLWDKFAEPRFRAVRAGVFVALGLSGVIPACHYVIQNGFWDAVNNVAMGWLVLMAFLYIFGAFIYAIRFPERIFPGKCDIWFQSHQIFHMFVLAGAFVHYHGISEIANYRLTLGDCVEAVVA